MEGSDRTQVCRLPVIVKCKRMLCAPGIYTTVRRTHIDRPQQVLKMKFGSTIFVRFAQSLSQCCSRWHIAIYYYYSLFLSLQKVVQRRRLRHHNKPTKRTCLKHVFLRLGPICIMGLIEPRTKAKQGPLASVLVLFVCEAHLFLL